MPPRNSEYPTPESWTKGKEGTALEKVEDNAMLELPSAVSLAFHWLPEPLTRPDRCRGAGLGCRSAEKDVVSLVMKCSFTLGVQ